VDGVLLHEQEGEAFLLHVPSGRYFGLNRSGLVVWRALLSGQDPVDELRKRWPDEAAEVHRADAAALASALVEAGLAQKGPPSEE
jgi:coenzyme PQQ synthesis protein D (PqqD)